MYCIISDEKKYRIRILKNVEFCFEIRTIGKKLMCENKLKEKSENGTKNKFICYTWDESAQLIVCTGKTK